MGIKILVLAMKDMEIEGMGFKAYDLPFGPFVVVFDVSTSDHAVWSMERSRADV